MLVFWNLLYNRFYQTYWVLAILNSKKLKTGAQSFTDDLPYYNTKLCNFSLNPRSKVCASYSGRQQKSLNNRRNPGLRRLLEHKNHPDVAISFRGAAEEFP